MLVAFLVPVFLFQNSGENPLCSGCVMDELDLDKQDAEQAEQLIPNDEFGLVSQY